eukprot:7816982-Alexandrium_andersonii.AAC.1
MSASLVGSEMCIRDRFSTESSWVELGMRAPRSRAGAWRGMLPGPAAEAVSYTHLTLPTICSV